MKKITCLFFLLAVIHAPTHAEVFKCKLTSEKTVYQSTACPSTAVSQKVVEIEKPDAEKIAEAQARFAAWKADLAAREAAELKAEKERQEALARQESVNALKRSAIAQEELAEAAKRPVVINPVVQPYWPYLNPNLRLNPNLNPRPNMNPEPNMNPNPNPNLNSDPAQRHHRINH